MLWRAEQSKINWFIRECRCARHWELSRETRNKWKQATDSDTKALAPVAFWWDDPGDIVFPSQIKIASDFLCWAQSRAQRVQLLSTSLPSPLLPSSNVSYSHSFQLLIIYFWPEISVYNPPGWITRNHTVSKPVLSSVGTVPYHRALRHVILDNWNVTAWNNPLWPLPQPLAAIILLTAPMRLTAS